MLAESAKNLVPKFFDETGTTYDGVVSYGTLGKDKYWKRKILEQISNGNSFLDLACGTGILTREIAKKFPNAKIVGIDITKSYLDVAKNRIQIHLITSRLFLTMQKSSNWIQSLTASLHPIYQSIVTRKYL